MACGFQFTDKFFYFHFATSECETHHLAVGLDSTPLCCPVEHNKHTVLQNTACHNKWNISTVPRAIWYLILQHERRAEQSLNWNFIISGISEAIMFVWMQSDKTPPPFDFLTVSIVTRKTCVWCVCIPQ